jgi:hypothetical protein
MIRMKDGTFDHIIMDSNTIMVVRHQQSISNVIGLFKQTQTISC